MSASSTGFAKADEPGVYYVNGQTWQVGIRYQLLKVLGSGSFSAVCLALDTVSGDKVAVKRIGDVLGSVDYAKRVLREVCILRRLDYPHIIRLLDVFLKPSPTGRYVYRSGKLIPTSLDCYLVTEFADQGDLFNLKGQLAEEEVRSIMYQLLGALRYMHGLQVIHRDIKSANVLMLLLEGRRVVKIADLGSARSAVGSGVDESSGLPVTLTMTSLSGGPSLNGLDGRTQSLCLEDGNMGAGGQAGPAGAASGHAEYGQVQLREDGGGFMPPLTRLVCTPCYRAPEVVMSRGGYTSAMDMWSLGCIFGELLQRVPYLGKATTPHLQVAPVFALNGMLPATPQSGDHYANTGVPGNPATRQELQTLFSVIGTPAWRCIDAVQSRAWKRYLYRIPGRAPMLYRRFGAAGEVAVDLLTRLLTFDPARRCSAEEAMAHEYFAAYQAVDDLVGNLAATDFMACDSEMEDGEDPQESMLPLDPDPCQPHLQRSGGSLAMRKVGSSGQLLHAKAPRLNGTASNDLSDDVDCSGGAEAGMEVDLASPATAILVVAQDAAASTPSPRALHGGDDGCGKPQPQPTSAGNGKSSSRPGSRRRFWEIDEPALALAALEAELAKLDHDEASIAPLGASHERMREMLQHECDEHTVRMQQAISLMLQQRSAAAQDAAGTTTTAGGRAGLLSRTQGPGQQGGSGQVAAPVVLPHGSRLASFTSATPQSGRSFSTGGGMLPSAASTAAPGSLAAAAAAVAGGVGGGGGFVRRNASAGRLKGSGGGAEGDSASGAGGQGTGSQVGGVSGRGMLLTGHLNEWRPTLDPADAGYQRIPFHADAGAANLEPELHLRPNRHGEWCPKPTASGLKSGDVWGVTVMPPGLHEVHEDDQQAIMDVIRSQHAR